MGTNLGLESGCEFSWRHRRRRALDQRQEFGADLVRGDI